MSKYRYKRFPVLCHTSYRYPRPRYQVSVYATNGPLVSVAEKNCLCLTRLKNRIRGNTSVSMRKQVFEISDQVRNKLGCAATEYG